MSSHGGLLSVCSKNFVKFCVVLSNICIWAWLYVSSGSLQRWSSYVFRVFMLHLWGFLSKKSPPKSRVIVVCSGLERIGKSLKIRKNGWPCEALERWKFLHSQLSLVHDKWDIFWLTSFESCIRAWVDMNGVNSFISYHNISADVNILTTIYIWRIEAELMVEGFQSSDLFKPFYKYIPFLIHNFIFFICLWINSID